MSYEFKATEKELEILQILWEKGPSSVRMVLAALGGEDVNGYTTILKLLQIMYEKGLVTRQKAGKLHLYKAVPSKEGARQFMLNRIIKNVFQGSTTQLVLSALGNQKSTPADIEEIRKYLDKLEGGKS